MKAGGCGEGAQSGCRDTWPGADGKSGFAQKCSGHSAILMLDTSAGNPSLGQEGPFTLTHPNSRHLNGGSGRYLPRLHRSARPVPLRSPGPTLGAGPSPSGLIGAVYWYRPLLLVLPPVQVTEQGDLGTVVQRLAVDVHDQRRHRLLRERALGQTQHHQRPAVIAGRGEEQPGLAEQERPLDCRRRRISTGTLHPVISPAQG